MAEKVWIEYEDSKLKKQGGLDQEILEWIQEKEGSIANEYLYFKDCSISEKGIQVMVKDSNYTVIILGIQGEICEVKIKRKKSTREKTLNPWKYRKKTLTYRKS